MPASRMSVISDKAQNAMVYMFGSEVGYNEVLYVIWDYTATASTHTISRTVSTHHPIIDEVQSQLVLSSLYQPRINKPSTQPLNQVF
jgi:hypothetical protein